MFVPRKVAQQKSTNRLKPTTTPSKEILKPALPPASAPQNAKPTPGLTDEEYIHIISLALSDYTLWSSPELHHTTNDGWISLLSLLPPGSNENTAARALRGREEFEVRLVLSPPSWSSAPIESDVEEKGMYEIRRKQGTEEGWERKGKEYWDARTLYLERIPQKYNRTPSSLSLFLSALLPQSPPTSNTSYRIQSVKQHHAKGRSWAFVVLSNIQDVNVLVERWAWDSVGTVEVEEEGKGKEEEKEARTWGFRCMLKSRYEHMEQEYEAYRQLLIQQQQSSQPSPPRVPQAIPASRTPQPTSSSTRIVSPPLAPETQYELQYPPNHLVHILNIHPSTNKTTLRSLFLSLTSLPSTAIDYVDYTKGMDHAYIRFTSSSHASALVSHFTSHHIRQESGLDSEGVQCTDEESVKAEMVTGKREELYWMKVPEKIRLAALTTTSSSSSFSNSVLEPVRKRKKR